MTDLINILTRPLRLTAAARVARPLRRLPLFAGLAASACLFAAPAALASAPAWTITSVSTPTNFPPGDSSGRDHYSVTATNSGGAPTTNGNPITVSDQLPPGLTLDPAGASGTDDAGNTVSCVPGPPVTCTDTAVRALQPGQSVVITVPVDVAANASGSVTNLVTATGGGPPIDSVSEPTTISATPAAFGIQSFDGSVTDQNGGPFTQAGGHPDAATTTIFFNTTTDAQGNPIPAGSFKTIQVNLPPGFIGDPNATPKCPAADLTAIPVPTCPASSQVGVTTIITDAGRSRSAVYNLQPPPGAPAQFGFMVTSVPVYLNASVRTGSDYGVTVTIPNNSQALTIFGTTLTFWGVPADHNGGGGLRELFLTNPTLCGGPLLTTLRVNSWEAPDDWKIASFVSHDNTGNPFGADGCNLLDFSPSITVRTDTSAADSPSGLNVDLHLPQNDNPDGLAEASLKDAVVTLPPGVSVNPSAANGLAACTPAEIGIDNANEPSCPDASKIGSVEVNTPLLSVPLTGAVYVAQQTQNPFGSLLAIYVTAEADGALVKLAGHVVADPVTGQLSTTFDNNPQLPFEDFKLVFFGGPAGVLATPDACGTYTTNSAFTPWSGTPPILTSDSFTISSGCVGGFSPAFTAGTQNVQAGAFSPFVLSFSRSDTDQELSGLSVTLPPGLLAKVAGVPLCSDAALEAAASNSGAAEQANPSCPAGSQVGTVQTGAGPGPDPFFLPGKAYLTGPYKGAPYGLAVVVPALAGPFDLGTVVVRQALYIDPATVQVTAVSDPFPTILDGIPVRIRRVDVNLDRPGFMFNPTNCSPMSVSGTITSTQGTAANVSSRFQASECRSLPFKPKFSALTSAKHSRKNGASLHVVVQSGAGQANIGSVKVNLPKQLPSRLSTLKLACLEKVFAANPATCPAGSKVGSATAYTPVLPVAMKGPAYFVSHGGAKFPELVVVLQGDGVTVELAGETFISKAGITSSTFRSVPDVPITRFDLVLPTGADSALAGNGNFCKGAMYMPTQIKGQNGAVVKQSTKIAVTGCAKHKKVKPKKRVKKK